MKITQNDRKEIVVAIQSGKTTKELADKYGVTSYSIGSVYREETGEGVERVEKLSQSDKEAIVAALQSGKADIQELATTYRVAPGTISRNFKKMVGKAFRPQRLSQIDKNLFVTDLQSGEVTIEELTTRYEVSRDAISRKFKQIAGKSLHPRKLLSQRDRETIVQELQSGKMTNELAGKYDISSGRISQIFQEETGQLLRSYKAVEMPSRYRAWHKQERKMYDVWGIDWFEKKILIQVDGSEEWQSSSKFILMGYSRLRDKKRTPKYPVGREIYAGDIVQFPINFSNGKREEIKAVVAIEPAMGWFVVVSVNDDPLCMHNDECEVIGTIQENPELLGSELQKMRKLLKKYTFA